MSYDKGKTIKEYMQGGYAQPMKYQTGGYIPGISRQLFGMGLRRDVATAQQEQIRQAKKLEKQEKRRGLFGKLGSLGGTIAGGALATALAPVTGGASLLAGAALAKGLGSASGSFLGEKLAEGVTDTSGVGRKSSTGLLGSGFDRLKDMKTEAGEGVLGRSLATGVQTGLMAGGADYLMNLGKGKDVLEAAEGVGGQSLGQTQGLGLNVEAPSMTDFDLGRFYGNVPSPASETLSSASNTGSGLINQGTNLASSIGDMDFTVDQLFQEAYGTPTFDLNQGGKVYGYENGGVIEMLQNIANKASFGRRNQVEDIEQVQDIEQSDAPTFNMEDVLNKKRQRDAAIDSQIPLSFSDRGDAVEARNKRLVDDYGSIQDAYDLTRAGELRKSDRDKELYQYRKEMALRDMLLKGKKELDFNQGGQMQGYAGGGLINMLPFNRRIM